MSSDSFLKSILAAFADSLLPLRDAVASPDAFAQFLTQFGWTLPAADLQAITGSLAELQTLGSNSSAQSATELAAELVSAARAIRRISESGAPAAFISTFPQELLDYLVYFAVAEHSPPTFALLHFVGVLGERQVPAGSNGRGARVERQVRWERLGSLADQPLAVIQQSYGWGGEFDAGALLHSLGLLVRAFGGRAGLYLADRELVAQYYAPGSPAAAGVSNLIVSAPFLEASVTSDATAVNAKAALLVIGIPAQPDVAGDPDGLALMPVISGTASDTFTVADNVTLALSGDFLARPVRAELHPSLATVRASGGDTHVDAAARLDAKAPVGMPWLALGTVDSSRLEISAAHARLGIHGGVGGDVDVQVEIGLDTATLVIDLSEGDSFVQSASSQPARSQLSLVVKWSSRSGFSLGGQPKLAVTLPVQQSLGSLAVIDSTGFALGGADGDGIAFDATLTFTALLGPLTVTLTDAGVRTLLRPVGDADPPGNLGNADLGFGFKAPSGMGVTLDAAGVTGGGYLASDVQKAEYAGALDLSLWDVAVKSYGLVQTKLPGGLPGYSFVVVLSTEFSPAVQLPFGFSLNGVGGLIGVNRTIAEDAVRSALWAHHLDGLLFPADPVVAAPQLLTALDGYFPAAPGRYVLGPLARIGWGDGIVEGDLALLVELPEPLKVLLIGDVAVGVPSAQPVLVLHISFDGGIDFGKRLAFFDATLHDSKIASYPISGDLAFRYDWGDEPLFALALGGFNPHFQPPASFPALKRLAITVSSSVARLEAQGYLALTSNTLQFGASVELTAGTGTFSVHGFLGFDALCERDPFAFAFDLSARVDLRAGSDVLASVHLAGHLSGPSPWHISGEASLSLLFFDITVRFDRTWGTAAGALPAPDPVPVVLAALADRSSWSGALPPAARAAVSLAGTPEDGGDAVLLDPAGSLRITQRAVPLGQPITRFGGHSLGRVVQLSIDALNVLGVGLDAPQPTTEEFAPAQFLDLSDADKLSLPSFSRFAAGVDAGGDTVDLGSSSRKRAVLTTVGYETTIVDSRAAPPRAGPEYAPGGTALLAMDSSAQPVQPGLRRYTPAVGTAPLVSLAPGRWLVAGTTALEAHPEIAGDGSKLGMRLALQQYLAANPAEAGQLQVVLAGEAE